MRTTLLFERANMAMYIQVEDGRREDGEAVHRDVVARREEERGHRMRLGESEDAGKVPLAKLQYVVANGHEPSEGLQRAYRRGAESTSNPAGGRVVSKSQRLHALFGAGVEPCLTTVGHDREDTGDVEAALLAGREAAFGVAQGEHQPGSTSTSMRCDAGARGVRAPHGGAGSLSEGSCCQGVRECGLQN